MRLWLTCLALLAAAPAASAQTQLVESRYDKLPWWMDQPIIASTGFVERELPTNRANFNASFQVVERTAAEATKKAADRVRELSLALIQPGADKVRVETNFSIQPIYEQYRDKEGNRIDNQRADKIERYSVNAQLQIEVRDLSLLERAYAAVLITQPTYTSPVTFSLIPSSEVKTDVFRAAISDAQRRAKLASEASGAKLGPVKLIDPTGRACQTDVLVARAPRSFGPGVDSEVEQVVVTAQRRSQDIAPAPSPPARPTASQIMAGQPLPPDQALLPLQPPLTRMSAQACVIYALAS
jgi:uncharacterized protein YggE